MNKESTDEIFERCVDINFDPKNLIDATTLKNHIIHPYATFCHFYVSDEFKDLKDEFSELIFEAGDKLEREYYETNKVPLISQFLSPEHFKRTISILKKGLPIVGHVPLLFHDLEIGGVADVLIRDDNHPSVFGDFHYVVKDIKLSKEPDKKDHYKYQIAFYNYLLGKIQGYQPHQYYLINDKLEDIPINSNLNIEIEQRLEEIRRIRDGKIRAIPTYGGKEKKTTGWNNFIDQKAVENKCITCVKGVTFEKFGGIKSKGINTYEELATKNTEDLIGMSLKNMKTAGKIIKNAKRLVINKPEKFSAVLPKNKTEVYLDIENINYNKFSPTNEVMVFMVATLIKTERGEEIKVFSLKKEEDYKLFVEKIFNFINSFDDPVFYHYNHTERSFLEKQFLLFNFDKEKINLYSKRCFDLRKIIDQNGEKFPTYTNNLKDICGCLGFKWKEVINGSIAMGLYNKYYKTGDEKILKRIETYNEDDVRALKFVKDWLANA